MNIALNLWFYDMKLRVLRLSSVSFALFSVVTFAQAHPHVWVTVQSTLIAQPDGQISAIRHAWTFDEPFSAYATIGLDVDKDGKLSRQELSDLAKVNVDSLSEYTFFTRLLHAKASAVFAEPVDYYLAHDGKALTLNFTLPLKSGAMALNDARLEVSDPSFFVSFEFAKDDPIKVEGFKGTCKVELKKPAPSVFKRLSELGESAFEKSQGVGLDFATPVSFSCK
ncbi:COG3683 ABC-type uncharacterized transport system, periplasmic component [Rhabdaerophilaceae bacterium]